MVISPIVRNRIIFSSTTSLGFGGVYGFSEIQAPLRNKTFRLCAKYKEGN
jgi:hypothetical protein